MKKNWIIPVLAIVLFLVQAACAVGATATQAPDPTVNVDSQISTGIALTSAAQEVNVIPPTDTQQPAIELPTSTPEIPTATEAPSVQGTVNQSAYCRSGPGGNFPYLVIFDLGVDVEIIGQNKDTDGSQWWVVRSSGNEDCWIADQAVTFDGDKSIVANVSSPPTPTPVPPPTWSGTWTHWMRGGFSGATDASGQLWSTGNTHKQHSRRIYTWDTSGQF